MLAPKFQRAPFWGKNNSMHYRIPLTAALSLAVMASCSASPSAKAPPKTEPKLAVATPKAAPPEPAGTEIRTDFWLSRDPQQGAVVIGRAPSNTSGVSFNGTIVPMDREGFFVIGFDRDAENSASLTATLANGKTVERYLPVQPGQWKIEHVKANPTGGAGTTEEFKARRGPELAQINAARAKKVQSEGWRQEFAWPIQYKTIAGGRISGLFGSQRIYNGHPGSYHGGMDIAAPSGTIYTAPADGVVVLAAKSPFTLEGYLLMIDHGMGLNSAFLHSSALLVSEGERVKQGQPLGKVGMTGRASGPHLHWGLKWNSARVDPLKLVKPI